MINASAADEGGSSAIPGSLFSPMRSIFGCKDVIAEASRT